MNTLGRLLLKDFQQQPIQSVFDACNRHDYRFDPSAPVPLEEEDCQVVVLGTSVPLSDQQKAILENHCNPLQENDKSGKNKYLSCLRILCSLISQDLFINQTEFSCKPIFII